MTNPFNQLGQIIAAGGERAVANLIASGADDQRVLQFFARNYPQIGADDRDSVVSLAGAGLAAGSILTNQQRNLPPFLGTIPVDNAVLGDETGGARIRLTVALTGDDGKTAFRVDLDADGTETIEQLIDAALFRYNDAIGSDPSAKDRLSAALSDEILGIILFADRKF
jgi:hypothetical protein